MPGSQLNVRLYRDSFNTPWGFRLQGGKDLNQPLTVQRVFSNSPAEGELQRGDIILAIGGEATAHLSHKGAQDAISNSGGQVNLVVNRPPPGCVHISPLSPPIATQRPRAPSLQQPPSMPSRSPYGIYNYGQPNKTPAQRIEPGSQNGVMLNRVQSSLDNITLSPRTPEPSHRTPFYQGQGQEVQFFTPTSLLLEQQKNEEIERQRQSKMQQQLHQQQQQQQQQQARQYPPQQPSYHISAPQQDYGDQDQADDGEEPVVPVWERRKQFQEAPPKASAKVRTPKSNPVPKVSRPAPGPSTYTDFGLSYRPQNQQQANAVWQPSAQPKPPQAPPPQVVHYASSPAGHHHVQSPVKSAPPPWQRPQDADDETDSTPAWRNTLRTTGVKPWDVDLNYSQAGQDQDPQRSVPYNPTPYQTMYSPKAPTGDARDGGDAPKIVHLQYNSPMGLYSKDNIDETYRGQVSGLTGGQQASPQPQQGQGQGQQGQGQQGQGLPGGRDWSQSQVFQFIQQDKGKKSKGKAGPATAPKPHAALRQYDQPPQKQQHHAPPPQQHQQHQQPQVHQTYHDEIGISDF